MSEGNKIRVLIVDDVAETRENVRKLLQFEADIDVVAAARNGKEAIQLSQEAAPDVVLMDINMPDMDGITATEQIRLKMPFIQVVILSVQGDQNYMRRALQVGARDFLTKPPMPDELVSAIRRAGKVAQEERAKSAQTSAAAPGGTAQPMAAGVSVKGNIIMVYSPKGGNGCTTLAVNLAIALHNEETRVALVDANLQFGDVAIFMNEQGKNTVLDLALRSDELDPEVVNDVMINNAASGVHILAAPSRPEHAEKVDAEQFTKVMRYLRQMFAYVIVDTSPYLTDVSLSILDMCDAIILVTTQDIPSIKNNRLFLDLLQTLSVPLDKVCFVMNRYDKRIPITPERIAENLKQEIAAVIPLDERTVITAVNRGIPFMLDSKTQPVARGVYTLAESLRARLLKRESEELEKIPKR
ncbi:MAG: response regulator [Chloroflexota bacterium]